MPLQLKLLTPQLCLHSHSINLSTQSFLLSSIGHKKLSGPLLVKLLKQQEFHAQAQNMMVTMEFNQLSTALLSKESMNLNVLIQQVMDGTEVS